jgi:hypothetical protein
LKTYQSPNGSTITEILEQVHCGAAIESISDDGKTVVYSGGTDVFWDDQKPVVREGKLIFLDDNGDEWTFDQLTAVEETVDA